MPNSSSQSTFTVALLGNPNTGKSTLFNALVGVRQRVGNYPGVTVEKKTGQMEHDGRRYEVVDLPGLYSLAPRSRDEMVAVDLLLGRFEDDAAVDAVICIVDAANLQRHLYLVSQLMELGLPIVVAVNMLDVAEQYGIRVDLAQLRCRLGVPVVGMQAHRGIGIEELKSALAEAITGRVVPPQSPMPLLFQEEAARLGESLAELGDPAGSKRPMARYVAGRLLLDVSGYMRRALFPQANGTLDAQLNCARERLLQSGWQIPGCETTARYDWARQVLEGVVSDPGQYRVTLSDRIDRVLTHRVWGTLIFLAVMLLVFQAVFVGAVPFMDWIETGFGALADLAEASMADGSLRSLLVNGVIGGVGGVVVFLPQIMILFLFIAVLEDCGYMARGAYLMDRMMVRVGLSGKSFIPMLSSFACAIPGIMAARVIEDERDRLTTILVAPLMTCSARLPVYALLIAAFIPQQAYLGGLLNLQGLTLAALYALGILMAIVVASLLKRTLLRGETPPFLMELPSYKRPSLRTVLYRIVERGWVFLRTAGTIIFAVSIVIWAAIYYPHTADVSRQRGEQAAVEARLAALPESAPGRGPLVERFKELDHEIEGEYQRQSFLGRAGRLIEPVFRPLGWDWRISCAVLSSFPAREVVVATLGVIYNLGDEVDAESETGAARMHAKLREATWDGTDRRVFNIPVALSIMVFFALCAQCAATLAVIRRETNSWRWPLFAFAYMNALAYVAALLTYQLGMWIAG